MKKKDVVIGETYWAKVSGKIVPVKITDECIYGGWAGVNDETGRAVRIKSCQRLRGPVRRKLTNNTDKAQHRMYTVKRTVGVFGVFRKGADGLQYYMTGTGRRTIDAAQQLADAMEADCEDGVRRY